MTLEIFQQFPATSESPAVIRILSPREPGGCPGLCSGSSPSADGGETASGWMLPPLPVAWRTQWWGSGSSLIPLDGLGLSKNSVPGQGALGCLGELSLACLEGGRDRSPVTSAVSSTRVLRKRSL